MITNAMPRFLWFTVYLGKLLGIVEVALYFSRTDTLSHTQPMASKHSSDKKKLKILKWY